MKQKLIYTLLIFAIFATTSIDQLSAQCCTDYQSVNCPAGANWQDSKRSVGKMLIKNVWGITEWAEHCTGSLVNDAGMTGTDYFITAAHCFLGLSEAEIAATDIKIVWGEEVGCENVCVAYDEQHVTYGATFVKRIMNSTESRAFDLLLFELPTSPRDLPGFHPYYSGWNVRTSSADLEDAVGIHYPLDVRLCISDDALLGYSTSNTSCSIIDVTPRYLASYSSGENIDSGSSGSPLFDNQKNLIGVLSCSSQNCGTTQFVTYSSFYDAMRISCDDTEHTLECDLRYPSGEDYILTSVSGVDDLCPIRFKLDFDCDKFSNCILRAQMIEGQGPFTYSWNTGETTPGIAIFKGRRIHYRVEVTDANGCVAYASGYFEGEKYKAKDSPIVIPPSSSREVLTYPIPANNWLNVNWATVQANEMANEGSISIYDLTGRPVLTTQTILGQVSAKLNVAHLPAGVYFLKIEQQGELLHSQRLTIQR